MMEQEKSLEDANDETRIRFLEGNDLSPAELKDKIQEVELSVTVYYTTVCVVRAQWYSILYNCVCS